MSDSTQYGEKSANKKVDQPCKMSSLIRTWRSLSAQPIEWCIADG